MVMGNTESLPPKKSGDHGWGRAGVASTTQKKMGVHTYRVPATAGDAAELGFSPLSLSKCEEALFDSALFSFRMA